MSHESFQAWADAVKIEHLEDLGLTANAEALEDTGEGLTVELRVTLEDHATSAKRAWSERVTERELLREPQRFNYQLQSVKRGGRVLSAEKVSGGLRLTLDAAKPIKISAGEQLKITPILFLEALYERMKARALSPDSTLNLISEAEALVAKSDALAARSVISQDPASASAYQALQYDFRPPQAAAIEAAKRLPLTFIWGPPGTGKTHTLGHAVAQMISEDPSAKLLIVATANRGVEQMIIRADDAYQELHGAPPPDGLLLRTQVPTLMEFKSRPHLTSWSALQRESMLTLEGLWGEVARVEQERTLAPEEEGPRDDLNAELTALRAKIDEETNLYAERRAELIQRSRAVFCTITQHSFVPVIRGQSYSAVIFEEASMIPMYQVMDVMKTHPEARVIVSGDPRQLPPIVSDKLEGSDWVEHPFSFFGVDDPSRAPSFSGSPGGAPLSVLNFLDLQSRMPGDLGAAVSEAFYNGRLNSARGPGELNAVPQWPAEGLLFVDKEDVLDWPEYDELNAKTPKRLVGQKNKCELEARAAVILAREAISAGRSVLVLTPYRDQRALINALLRLNEVEASCSTVHSAQGDEADVVIFSLVSASAKFLTGDEARSLHTVAFSRAQHQLVVISDERCEENQHLVGMMSRWRRWER